MKLKDILTADFRNKKQREFVIDKFKQIPDVRDAHKRNKEIFKTENGVIELSQHILIASGFTHGVIFYHLDPPSQTCILFERKNKKGNFTTYSTTLKELFIKMAVFTYYYNQKKSKTKED